MSRALPAAAMSKSAAVAAPADAASAVAAKGKGKRRLLLLAAPVLLIAVIAGGWFSGILPSMLGLRHPAEIAAAAPADTPTSGPHAPVFMDLPLIVTNLNATGRRAVFVKLTAKLEIGKPEDQASITTAMPRLLDLFQTYLRETRPEELQGAAGTWRLREELVARANIAVTPARVLDVLFTEMLVQ